MYLLPTPQPTPLHTERHNAGSSLVGAIILLVRALCISTLFLVLNPLLFDTKEKNVITSFSNVHKNGRNETEDGTTCRDRYARADNLRKVENKKHEIALSFSQRKCFFLI